MPGYTISEAARLCGVNRRTLQRAIQSGRLILTVEHLVDTDDLRRAGYTVPVSQDTAPLPHLDTALTPQDTVLLSHLRAAYAPQDAAPKSQADTASLPQVTPQALTRMITLLEAMAEDLHALRTRLVPPRSTAAPLERPAMAPPQEDAAGTPHHVTPPPQVIPQATAPLPHHVTLVPQEPPQDDAAPVPHHDALTPQEPPQDVTPVAAVPQGDTAPVPHHTTLMPQETPQSVTLPPQVEPRDDAPVPHHAALTPHEEPQAVPHDTPQGQATPESPEALPPYIQRVAEVAAEYDKLSLSELAQLLYDRGIYRARDRKTGSEKPANRGTLQRWLDQARQAGVL